MGKSSSHLFGASPGVHLGETFGFDMGILSIAHGESKPRNMEIYIIGIYIIGIEATKM
jgi:hypothetical protein